MIEHLDGREKELESLGWRGPEAEWIALVCLHSGIFTRAQFCDYFDASPGIAHIVSFRHCWIAGGHRAPPLQFSQEGRGFVEYSASESTGRWGWKTSATGGRGQPMSLTPAAAFSRLRPGAPGVGLASHRAGKGALL